MNRFVILLELLTYFKFIIGSTQSGKFIYRGNVSYSDASLLISEIGPDDVSLRYCAVECYKNVDCNAVEICSFSINNVCRLSKNITTNLLSGQGTCSRYEIKHDCGDGWFFNRRTAECQCVVDCNCEAVTPPSGGVLSKTVNVGGYAILTNCINTGGHVWTMIQRRIDGSVNFYRGWTEYKNGFGDVASEFWIGLDNIRVLVQNGYTVLRVELEEGAETAFAEYSSFYIAGEADKYRIHVSGYTGTAGDGISCTTMHCNNDAQFSTHDNDNDLVSTNEALRWRGGWWYNDGHRSSLNGEYGNNNHGEGISCHSGEFEYRGNVAYSDVSLLISETGPDDVSLRYCAAECYRNVDCNAVELCSFPTKQVCRLSRSIISSSVNGQGTCSRHELKDDCDVGSFYNRRTNKCQCAIDCDCDAAVLPSGEVLPKSVTIDGQTFLTNCINTSGHVWTMIQRRVNGSVNFYRGWNDYKNGFGDVDSEFWIGLDNIRRLVESGKTVLRVELENGMASAFAEYNSFSIAGEEDNYRIQVHGYSGTAGDGISCSTEFCNNNAPFSTFDNDNDGSLTQNNAAEWRGAWWYHDGHMSNLNGEYGNINHGQGVTWTPYKGWSVSLSGVRMMLRLN